MYVRQAKQVLKSAVEGFDERKYGFASVVDLLRAAGKEGVVRIERDRQGAIRVFPGGSLTQRTAPPEVLDVESEADVMPAAEAAGADLIEQIDSVEPVEDQPIVEAELDVDGNVAPADETKAGRAKKGTRARKAAPKTPKAKAVKTARPRARKKT
jgi:hypothetical protein